MVKAANSWLRSVLRAGKQQQRSATRALNSLLAAPKPKAKPRPRPKPKPKAVTPPVTKARQALAAPPAAAGKWLASHFSAHADRGLGPVRRLSYWFYLPQRPPRRAGLPLLVMLHGCDQSATQFAQGTRMNHWADKLGYAVLYPQQSTSAHPHRCWKWYDRATQRGGGDVSVLAALVVKMMQTHPIDPARVYVCGMSAGAGMAHILALNHPELFAAVGLHSGPVFGAGHSAVGAMGVMQRGASHRVDPAIEEVLLKHPGFPTLPTILIHGAQDSTVRPVNQAQLMRQSMLLNRLPHATPVHRSEHAGKLRMHPHQLHDVHHDGKLMLRIAQISELAHAWSGGDASLAYHAGPGPDASRMLLAFFSQHHR
ncbi:MAG: alpha/beta hydrolase family esterase [Massilia sp.]